eukprot:2922053-Amphidinium_carterae.1
MHAEAFPFAIPSSHSVLLAKANHMDAQLESPVTKRALICTWILPASRWQTRPLWLATTGLYASSVKPSLYHGERKRGKSSYLLESQKNAHVEVFIHKPH